jgi:hypothetical protein
METADAGGTGSLHPMTTDMFEKHNAWGADHVLDRAVGHPLLRLQARDLRPR